jgi:hypothetical protein
MYDLYAPVLGREWKVRVLQQFVAVTGADVL